MRPVIGCRRRRHRRGRGTLARVGRGKWWNRQAHRRAASPVRSPGQGRARAVFTGRARLLSLRVAERASMKEVERGSTLSTSQLAREASIEVSCIEAADIRVGRDFLAPEQKVYVSHLPRQTWAQTLDTVARVTAAGFAPVPHVPIRLVESEQRLDEILSSLRDAGAAELLLISGDYARPLGPYSQVLDVLRSGKLQARGFSRISVAGHPEGHPGVPWDEIRGAQIEKSAWGAEAGMQVTIVTQFFFEAAPFIHWARELRRAGATARIVAGL